MYSLPKYSKLRYRCALLEGIRHTLPGKNSILLVIETGSLLVVGLQVDDHVATIGSERIIPYALLAFVALFRPGCFSGAS